MNDKGSIVGTRANNRSSRRSLYTFTIAHDIAIIDRFTPLHHLRGDCESRCRLVHSQR